MRLAIIIIMFILLAGVQGASASLVYDGSFDGTEVFTARFLPYGNWNYACFRGGVTTTDAINRNDTFMAIVTTNESNSCFGLEGSTTMRVELEQQGIDETEGTDRYYGFSFYLPSNFTIDVNEWINIAQWAVNKRIDYGVTPPLSLTLEGNTLKLYVCGNATQMVGACNYIPGNTGDRRSYPVIYNVGRDTWYDIVVHVKWSRTTEGFVYAWYQNASKAYGSAVVSESGKPTFYADTGTDFYGLGSYRGGGDLSTETHYVMDYKAGTTFEDVEYNATALPPGNAPNITSWTNTHTDDDNISFNMNITENVNFSITGVNQTITSWVWKDSDTDLYTGINSYFNISFQYIGVKNINVQGSNVNGTTQKIYWNVTVINPNQSVPLHLYGIKGNVLNVTNSIRNHTVSNKGDMTETVGLFADNCEDGTSDWTNSWTCSNGVLNTQGSYRTSSSQYLDSNYTNVTLFAKVNESALNLWELDLRHATWHDTIYYGYQMVRPATTTGLILQMYDGAWRELINGTGVRPTGTPYYAIFDINGSILNSYITSSSFSMASVNLTTTNDTFTKGNYFNLDGSTITFDDIRLTSRNTSGDIYIWDTSGTGNTTTSIKVTNCNAPAGTSCKLEWKGNSSETWIVANSSFSGNLTHSISSNKNQSNDVRITLVGTSAAFPSFDSVEFVQGTANTTANTFTIKGSGGDATWSDYWYEGKP